MQASRVRRWSTRLNGGAVHRKRVRFNGPPSATANAAWPPVETRSSTLPPGATRTAPVPAQSPTQSAPERSSAIPSGARAPEASASGTVSKLRSLNEAQTLRFVSSPSVARSNAVIRAANVSLTSSVLAVRRERHSVGVDEVVRGDRDRAAGIDPEQDGRGDPLVGLVVPAEVADVGAAGIVDDHVV